MIFLDSETSSPVDLRSAGIYPYFSHPGTYSLGVGVAIDDQPTEMITKDQLERAPLNERLETGERVIVFNQDFEYLHYKHCLEPLGWVSLPYTQFLDVSLMCRMLGLPHFLDGASRCASLALGYEEIAKDPQGWRVMRKFMYGDGYWDDEEYEKLCQYCLRDVELTRFLYFIMPECIVEQAEADSTVVLNEAINRRGLHFDRRLVSALLKLADAEKAAAAERMHKLTDGAVEGPSKLAQLKSYLEKRTGRLFPSLANGVILELLEDDTLDDTSKELLSLRASGGRSSTVKFERMLEAANSDDRIRGAYMYWGARPRRFSSKLVQLHNLPREPLREPGVLMLGVEADTIREHEGNVLEALPRFIRPCITAAPGKKLVGGDFAQIEARMLALIAGEDEVLARYRAGEDIYTWTASGLLGLDPEEIGKDSAARQLGKTLDLSAGYGGGVNAVLGSAAKFQLALEEQEARAHLNSWRRIHNSTTLFWRELMQAAVKAWKSRRYERKIKVGTLYFQADAHHLYCMLPSERRIAYPFVQRAPDAYGESQYSFINGMARLAMAKREWPRKRLWHGILVENVVQGLCADLLIWLLRYWDDGGYDVVGHTHDEFIIEVPKGVPLDHFKEQLPEVPEWCSGLPFAVDWWEGERYAK